VVIALSLWQLGFFGCGPGVCDPPPGSLNGLKWSEALVDDEGNFYVKVMNPHRSLIHITTIIIEPWRPSNVKYTIGTPALPLEVKGNEEFLITGKYEPIVAIKRGEEYIFQIEINFTTTVAGTVVEHEASGGIYGRWGIVEVPTC